MTNFAPLTGFGAKMNALNFGIKLFKVKVTVGSNMPQNELFGLVNTMSWVFVDEFDKTFTTDFGARMNMSNFGVKRSRIKSWWGQICHKMPFLPCSCELPQGVWDGASTKMIFLVHFSLKI